MGYLKGKTSQPHSNPEAQLLGPLSRVAHHTLLRKARRLITHATITGSPRSLRSELSTSATVHCALSQGARASDEATCRGH